MTAKIVPFPGAYAEPLPPTDAERAAIQASNEAYWAERAACLESLDDEDDNYDPECDCGDCMSAAARRRKRKEEAEHPPATHAKDPVPDDSDEPVERMNSHALWEEYRDLQDQIDDHGAPSPNIAWAWPRLRALETEIKARLSPSLIDITAPVAMPEGRV